MIVILCVYCILTNTTNKTQRQEISSLTDTIIDYEIENNRLNDVISDYEVAIAENEADLNYLKAAKIRYIGDFKIYFYCGCEQCCGKSTGITASGAKVQDGVTVAADTSVFPFGTKLYIKGVGERIVQDRGGAIKGNKIDVYVDNHSKIPSIGTFTTDVWMVAE